SGVIVSTAPGETLILTVAHAFEGTARKRPLVLLVPRPEGAGGTKKVGITLAAVDEKADLALVVLKAGPLPHAATVAPRGFKVAKGSASSCGYDGMRLPAACVLTRVLGSAHGTTFTEKLPGHGRSGGALLEAKTGYLIGIVQGYTVEKPAVG